MTKVAITGTGLIYRNPKPHLYSRQASFPALVRLVEGQPDLQVRVFLRDENPDLMDQFLKDGKYRSIPVIVFFDASMNEVGRFTERAPAGTDVVAHLKGLLEA